jgi:hypothetical protein
MDEEAAVNYWEVSSIFSFLHLSLFFFLLPIPLSLSCHSCSNRNFSNETSYIEIWTCGIRYRSKSSPHDLRVKIQTRHLITITTATFNRS